MPIDRQKMLLFGAAAISRLLLIAAFPGLPDMLTGIVEISTPVTSFKRLQEGLFLYTHNVSPYDGGVFHQAPLLLPLFSLLPDAIPTTLASCIVFTVVDMLCANAVLEIAESGESVHSRLFESPRKAVRGGSLNIAAAYLFNPFTVMSCLGRTTSVFTNCAILYAISNAVRMQSLQSMLALAFASYLSLYPALLLPPLLILCYDRHSRLMKQGPNLFNFIWSHSVVFVGSFCALLYISYLLTGASWEFLSSTYGVQLLLPDLTPNVGLWWYFFIEMFDSFREFFIGVFWLHLASYMGVFSIKFRKQPLFIVVSLLGIFAIFKPYPSISDTALYLSLLPLYRHTFPAMRHTFLSISTLMYASCLGPAFYYLWIYAGSGNANFFYAITLVWNLGLTLIMTDSMYGLLRDEWEAERPEMRGKDAKQIS